MSGIGYILLGLRGIIPDFVSIVIANPLLTLGYGHLYLGFRRHYGLPLGRRWDIYAAGLTAILFFVFTYVQPSLSSKIVSISLILAALGFASAWLCSPQSLRVRPPTDWFRYFSASPA